ncbi:MAG: hypothetical protein JNL72_14995 [Flavipsychrobacter sp.]|nr:hypothetical protein [Flavipsychrobacter sp.]
MNKLLVTSYVLGEETISATLTDGKTDCDYLINREQFEDWLTGGTGVVDMGFSHHLGDVLTEVEIKEPISDYWIQGDEINNSPVLEHLQLFVHRNEQSRCEAHCALLEQYLEDMLTERAEPAQNEAVATLRKYGQLKQETGEHLASAIYKRIILTQGV